MATKDYKMLQALLDGGGEIHIPDGVYTIDETLVIHDNTHLVLSHKATKRGSINIHAILLGNARVIYWSY